ncbi:MAG: hypothetical protein PHE56_16115, partial [Bacteroidales bacterium]|nr:hypothetical protein [Bacteroidales bacterium]
MKKRIFWILLLSFSTLITHAQNWDQVVKACASDRSDNSNYGYSVAIDGEYAVVGAQAEDFDELGQNRKINAGAAYVLHYNDTTWVEIQKLVASDRASLDYFGCSVSISGDYIFVGAKMEEDDIAIAEFKENLGAVYVFHNNSGVWTETQKLVALDKHDDDYFGSAVSLSGDWAIIGVAMQDFDEANIYSIGNAGAAYIFRNNSGTWSQTQKIVLPDRSETDYFGCSVSIDGDYVIIGAYAEDENELGIETILEAGAAYIYKNNLDVWTLEEKICAQDRGTLDFFGYSVSINGNFAIVGAYNDGEDEFGSETVEGAGSAYIFENNGSNWTQVNKIVSSDRYINDRFGYSVSISGEYAVVGAVFEDEDVSGEEHLDFSGSAYVFKNIEGAWQQSRKIIALDRNEQDNFGFSVAICDTLIITGAIQQAFDSTGGGAELVAAGAAYIYNLALRDISVWEDENEILCTSTHYLETVTAGTSSGPIVFTVKNEGVTNLSLTGAPKLVVSGADAAYFEIDESMLTSPIAPYTFSEFTVTFNPDEARDYQIQISISTNDQDENPFYFIINAPGGKIPQTITDFAPIAEKTYGDDPFTVSANASSGLAVEFSSSNPDVAICTGLNGTTVV